MKIFIFGAGASKGSQGQVDNPSFVSPLTDELFDDEYRGYATYGQYEILSKAELSKCAEESKNNGSVEQWLTQRWNNINNFTQLRTQSAEKIFFGRLTFYIWQLLQAVSTQTYNSSNAYTVLMEKLRISDQPFGLISFNYDTLLDRAAIEVFGETFTSIDDYYNFPYIKPHGSVNWILGKRDGDPNTPPEAQLDIGIKIDTAVKHMLTGSALSLNTLRVLGPRQPTLSNLTFMINVFSNQYFYPLIFMPLSSKLYPFVDGFSETIIQRSKELIKKATEIYLIGYNAKDDIIKDILLEAPAPTPLHIVKNGSAEQTMEEVLHLAPSLLVRGNASNFGFRDFAERYK